MLANKIIQAGMGIGISNWYLANTVATAGQIGVVSRPSVLLNTVPISILSCSVTLISA